MTLVPEPQSPSRTLKGESIRSLRELFQSNLSASTRSLPELDDERKQKQLKQDHDHEQKIEGDASDASDATNERADPSTNAPAKSVDIALQVTSRRPAHVVRSRLLQNLGIQKQPDPAIAIEANPPSNSEPWGESYTEPINDNGNKTSCAVKESKVLQFTPTIVIHPIPSHKNYSYRIKQTIWAGAAELGENVARNSLEFSYEDWDADRVLDEETGLIYYKGEWVHPVHFGIEPPEEEPPLSSDDIWRQTCERLGIQPAEYYHSIEPSTTDQ